jgi:hypothetical protein
MSCVFSFLSTLAACGTPTQIDSAKKKMVGRQTSCMYVWTHGQRKKERPKGDKKKERTNGG